jgi:hypothetical protein
LDKVKEDFALMAAANDTETERLNEEIIQLNKKIKTAEAAGQQKQAGQAVDTKKALEAEKNF